MSVTVTKQISKKNTHINTKIEVVYRNTEMLPSGTKLPYM